MSFEHNPFEPPGVVDTPPTSSAERIGAGMLIAAFVLAIVTDVAIRSMWTLRFGFNPLKFGSVAVTALLFYFALRGSPVARWLMVVFGVLGIAFGLASRLFDHTIGILMLAAAATTTGLLLFPQVGSYQTARRTRQRRNL